MKPLRALDRWGIFFATGIGTGNGRCDVLNDVLRHERCSRDRNPNWAEQIECRFTEAKSYA